MSNNIENLIREEYNRLSRENEETIFDNLIFSFIDEMSEHFDIDFEEGFTVLDLMESFEGWDLSEIETYQEILEVVKRKPGMAKRNPVKRKPQANLNLNQRLSRRQNLKLSQE
jgi:hypothetical protein